VHHAAASERLWTRTDALVLTAAVVWGANYSIVKQVLRSMTPAAFASVRLGVASLVFLIAIGISRWLRTRGRGVRARLVEITPGGQDSLSVFRTTTLSSRDWWLLVVLGAIGHFAYQAVFMEGLARTSVANASLLIGCTPMAVALASAALGTERLTAMFWIGATLSLSGIYLIVGRAHGAGGASFTGDVLVVIAVLCWVVYTLLGRELLTRHSPLLVTGYSMALGTVLFLCYGWGDLQQTNWASLERSDWLGIAYATFLSFNVSYILWYAGIQRLGSARTSLYSNLVPIVSLIVAAAWLGERIGVLKVIGAAAVLGGLALTRLRLPQRASATVDDDSHHR
jgi:drug/metabolite transporter (DMT)-like permease